MPTTKPTIVPIAEDRAGRGYGCLKLPLELDQLGLRKDPRSSGNAAASACLHGGRIVARAGPGPPRNRPGCAAELSGLPPRSAGEGPIAHHDGAVAHEIGAERKAADDMDLAAVDLGLARAARTCRETAGRGDRPAPYRVVSASSRGCELGIRERAVVRIEAEGLDQIGFLATGSFQRKSCQAAWSGTTLATPTTAARHRDRRPGNGSSAPNRYLLARMMKRSPSSWRTTPSEASKNARSKPSWTSISSTAKPMPALDRISRRLLATRLRQASGTERVSGTHADQSPGPRRAASEDLGRIGPTQPAQ